MLDQGIEAGYGTAVVLVELFHLNDEDCFVTAMDLGHAAEVDMNTKTKQLAGVIVGINWSIEDSDFPWRRPNNGFPCDDL